MLNRSAIVAIALTAALGASIGGAAAADASKFPNFKDQWNRIGRGGQYDPNKPLGKGQEPPLTAEYKAIWETHIVESQAGGQTYSGQVRCLPSGMPRMMMALDPMEIIVTPDVTYIYLEYNNGLRRIYTDGRAWPEKADASFAGYSIGKWVDEDGDGRYDLLEIETRDLKGPRVYDQSGIPFHDDNRTIFKERIFLDKANPDILRDEITTVDNALTRPWVVTRSYSRDHHPVWSEEFCAENNQYVFIDHDTYLIRTDGTLMPARKDQPPPDLRNFDQPPQ